MAVLILLFVFFLGAVEGLLTADLVERYRNYRLRRYHEERGKADEEIVCENAMVVFDGREVSWYDKDKMIRWRKG